MNTDLLIIDDSLTDLRLLMDMATVQGLRVSVALDGEKGYQQAVIQQPAVILLDVHMPVLDGFATCRQIKANPATRHIPVIFLTVANDLSERLEGFALGAVDYIGKPFHQAEVLARVGVHLRTLPPTEDENGRRPCEGASRPEVLARAAQRILGERIAAPPSLQELAALLGSNRRQLNDAFQAHCGQPAFAWLREERLRRAYELVCRTDTPISFIGDHLGYSTPANFTRAFHGRFGFSPRDMRRHMQAAPTETLDAPG
jgi:DNA-binding response OmpR family regulator